MSASFHFCTVPTFSIRSTSVPKMFMNNADDMLARSTVETWVIKAEKGEQGSRRRKRRSS